MIVQADRFGLGAAVDGPASANDGLDDILEGRALFGGDGIQRAHELLEAELARALGLDLQRRGE